MVKNCARRVYLSIEILFSAACVPLRRNTRSAPKQYFSISQLRLTWGMLHRKGSAPRGSEARSRDEDVSYQFEGSWYLLTALSWVILGVVSAQIAAPGTDVAALESLGSVVLGIDDALGSMGKFIFLIGAACLYLSFYRTKLIPRWLSLWGLIAEVQAGGASPEPLGRAQTERPRLPAPCKSQSGRTPLAP